MSYHPEPLGDWLLEASDPWPIIDRLRMALREAQRYTLGNTNITGMLIAELLDYLPSEDD